MRKLDLTGRVFGRLTAISEDERSSGKTRWKCLCECGNAVSVRTSDLTSGKTVSCGCYNDELRKQPKTHGMTYSRMYRTWNNMIQRCNNNRREDYVRYGGRGIRVCDEWSDFKDFQRWAELSGYSDELTLERKDNDGNYSPENCTWVSHAQQSRNTRRNVNITFNGETRCMKDWSKIIGINYQTLHSAIQRGHDFGEYARRKL